MIKKMFKWAFIAFGVLIALIVVIAVTSGGDDTSAKKTGTDAKTEKKQEDKVFKVGDKVNLKGIEITVQDAKFVPADQYTPAEKGKVLEMTLNVVNNTKNSVFIDSSEFNVYDKDGNAQELYFGGGKTPISGDLNKGKKMQGKLIYDVPEGTNYEMIYEPTFSWTDANITWDIQPK